MRAGLQTPSVSAASYLTEPVALKTCRSAAVASQLPPPIASVTGEVEHSVGFATSESLAP